MADALVAAPRRSSRPTPPTSRAARDGRHGAGTGRPAEADRRAGSRRSPTACARSPALPDPVGEVVRGYTLPNGLRAAADAGAARRRRHDLRGPAQRHRRRRRALPQERQRGAAARLVVGATTPTRRWSRCCATRSPTPGCRADAVQLVPGADRESVKHLMRARGLVDVLIPRGGAGLIRSVVEESTVPVIETGVGNCHVYVDADADLDMALDDRAQRQDPAPSASATPPRRCWSTGTSPSVPAARAARRCAEQGVTVHGDDAVRAYVGERRRAGDRRGLGHRVPLARPRRRRGRLARRRHRAHPPVRLRPHRGDRDATSPRPPGGSSAGSTRPP